MKKVILLFVNVLVIAALIVWGSGLKKAKVTAGKLGKIDKEETVTVTTTPVVRTTMQNVISLNGKVKSLHEAEISPKVSGKVSQIYFELGQTVNKGDILFKLDNQDFRLALEQAEAELKVTETSLSSSLVTAETNYLDAKRNYERLKRLYEKQIGSKQDLESAESAYKLAEDTYKSAKLAEENGTSNAQAQLEKARLAYEIAKTQLEYTVVRAPISGTIGTKDIKVGQYVGSNTTVATIVDLSSLVVETNVPEEQVNQLRIGDQAEVTIRSISEHAILGEIIAIAPAVSSTTLNYPVKIRVSNQQNRLKSGMFADIKLNLNKLNQVMAVPVDAISKEDGRDYVYILEGDRALKKLIKTGIIDQSMIQVTEGLSEKDIVVVKGMNQLKNGTKVIVAK